MASRQTTSAAELLARTRDGVLLYGLTPPRATLTSEEADAVAEAALTRLRSVQVDGLILYDVDAEVDRASTPRPFPFMPMMDPAVFLDRYLAGWAGPVVVYRAVSKYTGDELGRWLSETHRDRVLTVLVGAASRARWCARACPRLTAGTPGSPVRHAWAASSSPSGTRLRGQSTSACCASRMAAASSSSPRSVTTWTAPGTCCPTTPTAAGTRVWTRGRSC